MSSCMSSNSVAEKRYVYVSMFTHTIRECPSHSSALKKKEKKAFSSVVSVKDH